MSVSISTTDYINTVNAEIDGVEFAIIKTVKQDEGRAKIFNNMDSKTYDTECIMNEEFVL